MIRAFIIILYENVFQNPELFGTQVSLSPEQSTLVLEVTKKTAGHRPAKIAEKYSAYKQDCRPGLPLGPPAGQFLQQQQQQHRKS
jgi:hypothetical protein